MNDQLAMTDGFAEALERFHRLDAAEGPPISTEGRSRLLDVGRATSQAYVLLHGLTTTPAQLIDFAAALHAGGSNVLVPRLPRHGHADRMTLALAGLTTAELTSAAQEIVAIARGMGDRVTVVGFSAGGMLAAWIGQHLAVDRVVAIAPLLGLGWIPTSLGRLVSAATLRIPNAFVWWHPIERERHAPIHGYPRYATHAVARAWRLGLDVIDAARRNAPATADIALVSNASESTVNNRAIRRLADAWRSHAGSRVVLHRLKGLPLSHDIMEPRRRRTLAPQVYPALLKIVAGER